MTCDRQLLSSYRDAQLSPEERYLVDRHLQGCADCRRDLQAMVRIGQVVRSLPWEAAPPSIGREVRRKVAEREAARRRPLPLGGYARAFAPAAAFAGVALTFLVVFRPGAVDPLVRLPEPAAVTSGMDGAGAGAVAAQPATQPAAPASEPAARPVQPAVQPASAERPGNPKVDLARAAIAPTVSAPTLPDKTVAPSAPNVPSLASALGPADAAIPMPRSINRLYSARQALRDELGAPLPGSRTVTLLEQSFQGGLAIWRSDTRQIYVLRREGGSWTAHKDLSRPGERVAVDAAPPPGALAPAGGFGALWRATPEVKSRLGWAVYEPRGSGGTIQAFEHGLVVWSPHGLLYVLTNDGHWRTFADAAPV